MGQYKFSANLGFLWQELPLQDAVRAAANAGFEAVECHWPYDQDLAAVKHALLDTGLPMLGLNTIRGDIQKGDNGLSALPERIPEAQAAIDQAIETAILLEAKNIHVMAGFATGDKAEATFIENLEYACNTALRHDITILIEPLNQYDAPGYFLQTTEQARNLIESVEAENLRLMFDCYHVQLMEGDLSNRLERLMPLIGHIQFASVPDRGPPDGGEVNYEHIFRHIVELGYEKPLGAEYKPVNQTDKTLGWLSHFDR